MITKMMGGGSSNKIVQNNAIYIREEQKCSFVNVCLNQIQKHEKIIKIFLNELRKVQFSI